MKKRIVNSGKVSALAFCHPELVERSAAGRGPQLPQHGRNKERFGERFSRRSQLLVALLGLCLIAPLGSRAQTAATDDVGTLAKVTLHVGKASLTTQIAASRAQQERGLMFVAKLGDNDGMIFLLPKITNATFWMKNTLIPLSVAFIDKNGVILEIHDMKPMDETITRSDSDQVAYALETNLHWFALNGVKPGDKIDPAPATLGPPLP